MPYFSSDSYFAAILDPLRGGSFSIHPSISFSSRQSYITDTNILETHFETSTGKAKLTDCFSATTEKRRSLMFFPSCEILRKLEVTQGEVPFLVCYSPKPHYGEHSHYASDERKLGIDFTCGSDELRFISDLSLGSMFWADSPGGPEARAEFSLKEEERRFFSVSYHSIAPALIPALGEEAELRLWLTSRFWKNWVSQSRYDGPYREQVRRSVLALKLMTFAPSGAIIAAPTTSLPEQIGGSRNWDYRYGWTRDAAFTVRALLRLGFREEATAYLNWMLDTGAGLNGHYQIMYSLFGGRTPPERILSWFTGYKGSSPVRIGNAARDQIQLDIYGEILDSVTTFSKSDMTFDGETRRFLAGIGRKVCENWEYPDHGIWEPRGKPAHHTHSKVMSWLALDRLIAFCEEHGDQGICVDEFKSVREHIRDAVENRGYDPQIRSYTGVFGSQITDASLLTLPLVGYCDPSSERIQGTIERIRRQLGREDLVYRYIDRNDGLPGEEGCFGVCTFWLVDALTRSGRVNEARALFEKFLSRANSVGLWPEEIDPKSGEFLGNYPQAFTHVGLINSAITLQERAG